MAKMHDYRGMQISEGINKRTHRREYKVRFQVNKKRHYLVTEVLDDLKEMIDEILYNSRREKQALPVAKKVNVPTFAELCEKHAEHIDSILQKNLFKRVSNRLLELLPEDIEVTELRRAHFQIYKSTRLKEPGKKSKQPISSATVNRELSTIAAALRDAPLYFGELEDFKPPRIPFTPVRNGRRTRTVKKDEELYRIIAELKNPEIKFLNPDRIAARHCIADMLEFRLETGLRRKEVVKLKKDQFNADENALRDVMRWKTGKITPYLPLSDRAAQIVRERIGLQKSDYLFSENGEAYSNEYQILKKVCKKLGISYGKYTDGGFIPHDLRRNFATEIVTRADIKTVSALLGGSTIQNTDIYLQTDKDRLRDAVRGKNGKSPEIISLYKETRRGKIRLREFLEILRKLSEK